MSRIASANEAHGLSTRHLLVLSQTSVKSEATRANALKVLCLVKRTLMANGFATWVLKKPRADKSGAKGRGKLLMSDLLSMKPCCLKPAVSSFGNS